MNQKESLRFAFSNTKHANEAKKKLEKIYPQLIVHVTEHANMIVCSTRSITFDTRIEEEVTKLGGLIM